MFSPLKRRRSSIDRPASPQPIIHLASSRDITLQQLQTSLDLLPHETLKSILLSVLPDHPRALANFQSLYLDLSAEQAEQVRVVRASQPYPASWDALGLCARFPMTPIKIRAVARDILTDLEVVLRSVGSESVDTVKSGLGTCMLIGRAMVLCEQDEARDGMKVYGVVARLAEVMGDIAEHALQIGDEVYDGVVEDLGLIEEIKGVVEAMAGLGWGGFERVLVALLPDDEEGTDEEEEEKEEDDEGEDKGEKTNGVVVEVGHGVGEKSVDATPRRREVEAGTGED